MRLQEKDAEHLETFLNFGGILLVVIAVSYHLYFVGIIGCLCCNAHLEKYNPEV